MKLNIKKSKKNDILYITVVSILSTLIVILLLILYIRYIDKKVSTITKESDITFLAENATVLSNGLYELNIKSDLTKNIKKDTSTITYKINGESFYFELSVNEDGSYTITKIVDENQNINAKMSYKNIEKIQYRTGNTNEATLINLITDTDNEYLIITEGVYYFLGSDIESISFKDNHFYYVSYNSTYKALQNATLCDKETKKSIEDFSMSDTYYSYGKINFLSEFYQKLSSKTFTVKDRCAELEELNGTSK